MENKKVFNGWNLVGLILWVAALFGSIGLAIRAFSWAFGD